MEQNISNIITQYKTDTQSVFHTWFINNDERLKDFRAIRRGVKQVIDDIKNNSFGIDFKGSSLEIVMNSITEQKQVFIGAAHPFYWKPKLPTIKLIDELWFQKGTNNVLCAFEVEKSTSIYSGILRLTDLSYTISDGDEAFYLVVPEQREKDLQLQLAHPSIKQNNIPIKYILFSELRKNCEALCKFGDSHHIIEKISKPYVC